MSTAFEQLPGDQKTLAIQRALAIGARARGHLPTFFATVMREEKTQRTLVPTAHQRLLFEFVLAHPRCVLRLPAGTSKTFCMATLTLWLLGRNLTERGAIVSATQGQAAKVLTMVRDYIETGDAIRLPFPLLAKSSRVSDPWSQTEITVDRPPGIRDPSLVAVGIDGALVGSRLSWVVVDDILTRENSATKAGRQKVAEFFDAVVLSRLDPRDHHMVVCNTPWHPDDITFRLESAGWPTMTMDVEGFIQLANCDDWDSPEIRPSARAGEFYRLVAHDPDEEEAVPLWPERYPREEIERLRAEYHAQASPQRFAQLYLCQCRDEGSARCKTEWIEQCKVKGLAMVGEYRGGNPTATGVDLAIGQGDEHDFTALFTIELLPGGKRRILDVEFGRWDAPTIAKKIIVKHQAYNSIIRVENNSVQGYIAQFVRMMNVSVPVKAHQTGKNKADPRFGVESIFAEMQNGAWEIPCDAWGTPPLAIQKWIQGCLDFDPAKHVNDIVMASWMAREQARYLGAAAGGDTAGIAANLMSR